MSSTPLKKDRHGGGGWGNVLESSGPFCKWDTQVERRIREALHAEPQEQLKG